jgi:glycosyltransferase involved in cell wall biosynthesis
MNGRSCQRLLAVSHPSVLPVNQQQYRELIELGWHVHLVTPSRWKHAYQDRPFAATALPDVEGSMDPRRVLFAGHPQRHLYVSRLAATLRAENPSVVFLEQEPFSMAAAQWAIAAFRLGIPFGVQQDENLDREMPVVARWLTALVLPRAAFVIARSPAAAALASRWGAKGRVEVIPHPVPPWSVPERSASERQFTVGYAGRLVPEKGVGDLISAVKRMERPARVLLVGNGPLLREFEIDPIVEVWTGLSHDRMPEAYQRMDVLVLPSRRTPTWEEQFGRVLVEALHCDVPVVGSDTGEIPWVVESTGGGWLFPEGDIATLSSLLDEIADNEGERARRAQRGALAVQKQFSAEAVAAAMSKLLTSAIKTQNPPNALR